MKVLQIKNVYPNLYFGKKKQDIVEISEEAINEPKNILLGHTVFIDKNGTCFFDNKKIPS